MESYYWEASIKDVRRSGGGGSGKCGRMCYARKRSSFAETGEGGSENDNIFIRPLWMPPCVVIEHQLMIVLNGNLLLLLCMEWKFANCAAAIFFENPSNLWYDARRFCINCRI